jgi:hypothetical protein
LGSIVAGAVVAVFLHRVKAVAFFDSRGQARSAAR